MKVYREKLSLEEPVYSERLRTTELATEAAKIYIKWIKDHPEEDENTVDMCVKSMDEPEDAWGNPGYKVHSVCIYKKRKETEEEFHRRIEREENYILDSFQEKLFHDVHDLLNDYEIYSSCQYKKLESHRDRIVDLIMNTIREEIYKPVNNDD